MVIVSALSHTIHMHQLPSNMSPCTVCVHVCFSSCRVNLTFSEVENRIMVSTCMSVFICHMICLLAQSLTDLAHTIGKLVLSKQCTCVYAVCLPLKEFVEW